MRGVGFDFGEVPYDLNEVVLTKSKFSCKYLQGGYVYRSETASNDGIVYRGNWGYPDLADEYTLELKRFESKDKETVLLGQWTNAEANEVGAYLFRLNTT